MTAPELESGKHSPRQDRWFKSSFSNSSQTCVEVCLHAGLVSIRDSKNRGPRRTLDRSRQPILTVTAREWADFLHNLTDGAIDSGRGPLTIDHGPNGTDMRAAGQNPTLKFTPAEWHAYLEGVHAHEFDHPSSNHG